MFQSLNPVLIFSAFLFYSACIKCLVKLTHQGSPKRAFRLLGWFWSSGIFFRGFIINARCGVATLNEHWHSLFGWVFWITFCTTCLVFLLCTITLTLVVRLFVILFTTDTIVTGEDKVFIKRIVSRWLWHVPRREMLSPFRVFPRALFSYIFYYYLSPNLILIFIKWTFTISPVWRNF